MSMRKLGRIVHEICPTLDNPRKTEGAFALLKDGRIIFAFSNFVKGSGDDSEAEITAVYSSDDGESWSGERTLLKKRPEDTNIMSVSFLRLNDGALGMFYLCKTHLKTHMGCLVNLVRSYDEGETWSEPQVCTNDENYYVLNNDRVIRLKSGRVIFAVADHGAEKDTSDVSFFYSDDDCKSFVKSPARLVLPFTKTTTGLQEPGLVELDGGRLWCFARTGHAYQFEAYSEDGGITWSDVNPNPYFTSPNSPMLVKRIQDGRLLSVFNPIPNYNTRYYPENIESAKKSPKYNMYHPWNCFSGRTPLVATTSKTDAYGFDLQPLALEDDPELTYCYPAIFPSKDYLLISYFIGNRSYGLNAGFDVYGITIKKIKLSEI